MARRVILITMLVVMIITFARNRDLRNIHHDRYYGHGREQ